MISIFLRLRRLIQIISVMLQYGISDLLPEKSIFRKLQKLLPITKKQITTPISVRVRLALEELGPNFVKFGQFISTRHDLVSDELATELRKLQDQVPPFSGILAQYIVEQVYGQPLKIIFKEFISQPIASASISQVHAARLHDGREVVVKILRPNIDKIIKSDIKLLYTFAYLIQFYWKSSRRFRPVDLISEYDRVIINELDLNREAANASQLKHNFRNSQMLYVPEIIWPFVRQNILVMERIRGIPIGDIVELKRRDIDLKKLSQIGVKIFFTQVFRDRFFHADMHPGNIFVNPNHPTNPQYLAVDFGIMGILNPSDQYYLAENFLSFFTRNYRRIAELHIESGWVAPDTHIDEFEAAIRTVSEPIFNRPLKEISFGRFLLVLFQTARCFNMQVQPQLLLLQKTLLSIESLGRTLDPELDLWQTAYPFLENWAGKRATLCNFLRQFGNHIPRWAEQSTELPSIVYSILKQTNSSPKKHREDIKLIQRNNRYYQLIVLLSILLLYLCHQYEYVKIPTNLVVLGFTIYIGYHIRVNN